MSNEFYTKSGTPATSASGSSSAMRGEFVLVEAGFDKLPALTGNGNKVVMINAGGTGETCSAQLPAGTLLPTITGNLLFTDATYDIGASGATRPRDLFLSRNAVLGGTLGVTGVASLAAGAVNAPGVYLAADTGTGLYRIGANNDGFAVNGTKLLDLSAALLGVTGALTTSTTIVATGSVTGASFIPSSATVPANGMYLSAANTLAWATNSAVRMTLDATGNLVLDTVDITPVSSTFVPNLKCGGGEVTHTGTRYGMYFKVGKLVIVNVQLGWSGLNGRTGAVTIDTLPYTSGATTSIAVALGCSAGSVTSDKAFFANIDTGSGILHLADQAGDLTHTSLAAAGAIFGSFCYITA